MNEIISSFNDEKSSSNNFYNYSSESTPIDESIDSDEDSKSESKNKNDKNNKFRVTKKPKKEKRRNKEDNIRKKIKTSFLRFIKMRINNKLKKAGSKYTFQDFPQHFIAEINREKNHEVMQLTYGELFEYTYNKMINDSNYKKKAYNTKKIKAAEDKYLKNRKTLDYLNSNPKISSNSGWDKLKNMKYVDLLRDYFKSKEYEKSCEDLSKREDKNYIKLYKFFAEDYVQFFLDYQPNEKKNKNKNKTENLADGDNDNSESNSINNNYNSSSKFKIIINNISSNPEPDTISNDYIPLSPFSNYNKLLNQKPSLTNIEIDPIQILNASWNDDLRSENGLSSYIYERFKREWQ